jgi:ceramide glucosyltransferase
VVSDADVWVPEDFLEQAASAFDDPCTGLACSFYKLANQGTLAMRWESFAVNADFWSQVLQSRSLKPIDFALGAAMLFRRESLEGAGGFAALRDHLADDYELGHRIAASGKRVDILPVVVESRSDSQKPAEVWKHQLRWARTVRVCQPLPYFFSVLHNGTVWPLLFWLHSPSQTAFLCALVAWSIRMASASYCEAKLTRGFQVSSLFMAPLKDLLQVPVWLLAFTGHTVEWRGQKFRIFRGGRLARCEERGARRA